MLRTVYVYFAIWYVLLFYFIFKTTYSTLVICTIATCQILVKYVKWQNQRKLFCVIKQVMENGNCIKW